MNRLILIPWHTGHRGDVTLNAIAWVKRLHVLLARDPALLQRSLDELLGDEARGKELLVVPDKEDERFFEPVFELLKTRDVGLVSSAGTPCFADPGYGLVAYLRARDVPIRPLPGASILTAVLEASGIDWREGFRFCFWGPNPQGLLADVAADDQHVVVLFRFGSVHEFRDITELLCSRGFGARRISVFFDLTRAPAGRKYPYADTVLERRCDEWERGATDVDWSQVGDISFIVHPLGDPDERA